MTVAWKIGVSGFGLLRMREQRGKTNWTMPSNTVSERRVIEEGKPVVVACGAGLESQDFMYAPKLEVRYFILNRKIGKPRLSRRPVQARHCDGVRLEFPFWQVKTTHKLASLFVLHDIDVLVKVEEAAIFACLACYPKEVECLFDIELTGT